VPVIDGRRVEHATDEIGWRELVAGLVPGPVARGSRPSQVDGEPGLFAKLDIGRHLTFARQGLRADTLHVSFFSVKGRQYDDAESLYSTA